MAESSVNLSELKNPNVEKSVASLHKNIDEVDRVLAALCKGDADYEATYRNLDAASKAQHDIFLAYAINSLFWVYLKTQGRDASNHAVKAELGRVQEHMIRAKQLKDRTLAPRLDQQVARRFVRNGLWKPKEKEAQDKLRPNKRKRSDKDDC